MSDIGNLKIALSASTEGLKRGMQEAVQVVETTGKKMGDAAKGASANIEGGMKAAGAGTESLRTQLRKATQDAQRMAEQFGLNSKEFRIAAATAGELKDRVGDINTVINAMAADSKFTAVAGAMQAAAGSISIVTGAMGLLGVESESVQQTMLKVQSAIAFTQGVAQLQEMGAAFTALSVVIKTSVVPSLMTMQGALMATGIGAIVIAVGIAIKSFVDYQEGVKKTAEMQMYLEAKLKTTTDAFIKQTEIMFKASSARKGSINDIERQIKVLEAQGGKEQQIFVLQQKKLAMEMAFLQQRKKFAIQQGVTDDALLQMNEDIKNKEVEITVLRIQNQNRLRDASKEANKEAVKSLENTSKKIDEVARKREESISIGAPTTQQPGELSLIQPGTGGIEEIQKQREKENAELEKDAKELERLSENINQSFQGAIAGVVSNWAELTGAALAGAAVSFQSFGDMALQAISGFMKQMGEQMVSMGIAKIATDTLISIPFAGPGLVAAGTALIVAASFAATKANSSPMRGSSGVGGFEQGGTNQQSGGTIRLASGGIAFGESLAVVGDNRAARFDPEVIAPLSKLREYMDSGSSNVNVHGRLHGETILLSGVRAGQKASRKGLRY